VERRIHRRAEHVQLGIGVPHGAAGIRAQRLRPVAQASREPRVELRRLLKPRLGLKLDAASGDGGGRTLGTFDPLFPKYAYFTEAQLTEFMNVVSVFPSLTLAVTDRLAVTAGVDLLWRQSTRDAVYFPPLTPLPGTAGRGGHRVGTQTNLQAEWLLGEHLDLNAVWVHAVAGPALRAAGGRNTEYLGAWASFRF